MQKAEAPAPQAVLAIESRRPLKGELMSFYIDEALLVTGGRRSCKRGNHVYVLAQPEDKPLIPRGSDGPAPGAA
jgi:hypothetical protein